MSAGYDIPPGHSLVGPYGEGPVRIGELFRSAEGAIVVRGETSEEELVLEFAPEQFERFDLVSPYAERSLEFEQAFEAVVQYERGRLYRTTTIANKPGPYHLESSVPYSQRVRRLVIVARPAESNGLDVEAGLCEKLEASVGGLLALQRIGDGGDGKDWERPIVVSISELLEVLSDDGYLGDEQLEEMTADDPTGFETIGCRFNHNAPRKSDFEIVRACGHRGDPEAEARSELAEAWVEFAAAVESLDASLPRNGPRWKRARTGFLDLYTSQPPGPVRRPEGERNWQEAYADDREHHARLVRQIHRAMEYDESPPRLVDADA